jgi:hypothetical protein
MEMTDDGRWAMGDGRWAMGDGRWTVGPWDRGTVEVGGRRMEG